MANPDLIAWLFPAGEDDLGWKNAGETIHHEENQSIFMKAQQQIDRGIRSRESTAPPEDYEPKERTPHWEYLDRLQLTFSRGPKGPKGITFGTNANACDVYLPRWKCVSGTGREHCYLTFDAQNRLILQDDSTYGTIVTYDGQGGMTRRNFTWIIGGHKVPQKTEAIIIEFHRNLQFQIVVFNHEAYPQQYVVNVNRFRQQIAANAELPMAGLGLRSNDSTAANSSVQTPRTDAIRLKQRTLGKGSFAVVTLRWDVSTGEYVAVKEPYKRVYNKESWRNEIYVMNQIAHVSFELLIFHANSDVFQENVVNLVDYIEVPRHQLILEYVPYGNLEEQHIQRRFSNIEVWTILRQCLTALEFVHQKRIVHRDLKPENILVASRDPLHVKVADFGLAKEGSYMETVCGTDLYAPPEIAQYRGSNAPRERYTRAVDIWSLGVVILRFGYGLPGQGRGLEWCKNVMDEANSWESESMIDFLRNYMIVWNPEQRYSAGACLDFLNGLSMSQRYNVAPTPASYAEEDAGYSEEDEEYSDGEATETGDDGEEGHIAEQVSN